MSDEVKIGVNGFTFTTWESLTITRTLDSVADAFSLTAPFDPARPDMVEAFKPYGYQPSVLSIDNEIILTGRIESVAPTLAASRRAINLQGRSLTGSLVDCAIDGSGYQFAGMSLLSIAQKLCAPFGIAVTSTIGSGPELKTARSAGTVFEAQQALKEATATPGQSVFEFLQGLAQSAGLMLVTDSIGRLVITKLQPTGVPVAALIEGQDGIMEISAGYDGTQRFSQYKVLQQQDGEPAITGKAPDASVKIYRPLVKSGSDGDAKDINKAAQWARALALSASITVSVKMSGWRTVTGQLWTPGQLVTLKSPSTYINSETPFVIAESVLTLDTSGGRTADLRLVLPATYTGEMPGSYPWDL